MKSKFDCLQEKLYKHLNILGWQTISQKANNQNKEMKNE